MQDRIKQMADKAHDETDEASRHDRSLMDPEVWVQRMYTLFAQAVARDCVDTIRAMYTKEDWRDGEPYAMALGSAEEAIRARFGIEGE